MQKEIGVGILGCGRILDSHLRSISKIKNARLIAVADTDRERAEKAGQKYGAKRFYLTRTELFKDSEIDAVFLLLPHWEHCSAAVEAAQCGKHVLIEKPLALSVKDADKMIQVAKENNTILMVGHVQRFTRQYLMAKNYLKSGRLGNPLQIIERRFLKIKVPPTQWWKSSQKTGGLLLSLNGSHSIDFFLSLFNSSPVRVYCETLHNNPAWEGEDGFSIELKLANGAIISMHHSFNSSEVMNDVVIIGSKSVIRFNGISSDFYVNGKVQLDLEPAFEAQTREFLSSIDENRKPVASGEDVRNTVAVLEAARLSSEKHIVVEF